MKKIKTSLLLLIIFKSVLILFGLGMSITFWVNALANDYILYVWIGGILSTHGFTIGVARWLYTRLKRENVL